MSRTYHGFSITIHHEEFKIESTTLDEFIHKNKKCRRCSGTKQIYLDPSDPVEGHKLSRTGRCDLCKGSGDASLDDVREQYKSYEEKYNDRRDRAINNFLLVERLFFTFTDEELKSLGVREPNELRKLVEEIQL